MSEKKIASNFYGPMQFFTACIESTMLKFASFQGYKNDYFLLQKTKFSYSTCQK